MRRLPSIGDEFLRAAVLMESGRLGSFAGALGEAYIYADPVNREKLAAAFPDVFARALDLPPTLKVIK